MSSEPSSPSSKPGTILVYSEKSPEEARIFGLRGSDIKYVKAPTKEQTPVSPEEWDITDTNEEGICKYCQLMLHPSAPELTAHQPNLQSLIDSGETCATCKWLEVSLVRGCPQLGRRYYQGDPALCDPNNTTASITVSISRDPKHTRLIAVVGPHGFFADSGVPLNTSTPSRLGDLASRRFWEPYNESGSSLPHERLQILKTWLGECLDHENCSTFNQANRETRLPTRVLDLTGSPDIPSDPKDIIIKLRETSEEEKGSYVALSYCWGKEPEYHFQTKLATLDEYKGSIDFSSLPLTQREAVLATLYLGIRYLWIDSMCIIQDSLQDWEAEAAKMSTVYSNSLLTLAATSSSSPKDGLLNPFQAAKCVSLQGETVMVRMETHLTIDEPSEPLNTRGWTLQEAVLSPRLVCFGNEQWLWKCASRYATEDGLVDRPQFEKETLNQWAGIVRQEGDGDGKSYLPHWYRLVTNYSKRVLAYQSDKLKALAGLADVFVRKTGYQYVAGLWAEDISAGLWWHSTSRGVIRHTGNIPTWSWASVEGPVLISDFSSGMMPKLKLLSVKQEWRGVPLSSDLKVCHLTVSGMIMQVAFGKRSETQKLRYHLITAPDSEEIVGEGFLDNTEPIEQDVSTAWCLLVHSKPPEANDVEHFVLLLVPATDQREEDGLEAYRRIGVAVIWEKSRFADDQREGTEAFSGVSTSTVVLV